MAASLTEDAFSKELNTKFRVSPGDGAIDLELVEVKSYLSKQKEHEEMERFSAYFQGPVEPHLPQGLYKFQHEQMGEFDLFIVPVAKNDAGFRYEAVFNFFKSPG
jgi:hypothetical protein